MQKIKNTRWPSRNPYGDVLRYKLRQVAGGSMTIAAGSVASPAATLQINNPGAFVTAFGPAPGLTALGAAFHNYRSSGVKVKFTYWPLAPNTQPIIGFVQAGADNTFPTVSVATTPEQRWTKYRTLNFPGQGATPTKLSQYYSTNKVYGPDQIVKNDVDFTAATNVVSPFFVSPVKGPFLNYGITTLSGAVAGGTGIVCEFKIEVTHYLKYFGKVDLIT